jgi:pimeloyl-ACP methyl ester carboxylesterase
MFDVAEQAVTVHGRTIRYYRLGVPGNPPLMLVHGGGAHAGWWAGVASRLARRFDVVVPQLSGHGDSDHRKRYSALGWAAELLGIAAHVGWDRFDLAGHSMGGKVGVFLASRWSACCAAIERLLAELSP